jgi:Fe-Mn family superoxide dismutase
MSFKLPELPFDRDALNPHISSETIDFHYTRHHALYVLELNSLLRNSSLNGKTLEEVICATQVQGVAIFDNASQAWNHTFYWHCLCAGGSRIPPGPLLYQVIQRFGSLETLKREFNEMALSFFGSGWIWLVKNKRGRLEIVCSSNADTPIVENKVPLLVCDLWEHAYYIDYRNAKNVYLEHFWKLVNWKFAASNFGCNEIPNMTRFMSDPPLQAVARQDDTPMVENLDWHRFNHKGGVSL